MFIYFNNASNSIENNLNIFSNWNKSVITNKLFLPIPEGCLQVKPLNRLNIAQILDKVRTNAPLPVRALHDYLLKTTLLMIMKDDVCLGVHPLI